MKVERLNKKELVDYCELIGLNTDRKGKDLLMEEAQEYRSNEIKAAIDKGDGEALLISYVEKLAQEYTNNLKTKIGERKEEMKGDDTSHYYHLPCVGDILKRRTIN